MILSCKSKTILNKVIVKFLATLSITLLGLTINGQKTMYFEIDYCNTFSSYVPTNLESLTIFNIDPNNYSKITSDYGIRIGAGLQTRIGEISLHVRSFDVGSNTKNLASENTLLIKNLHKPYSMNIKEISVSFNHSIVNNFLSIGIGLHSNFYNNFLGFTNIEYLTGEKTSSNGWRIYNYKKNIIDIVKNNGHRIGGSIQVKSSIPLYQVISSIIKISYQLNSSILSSTKSKNFYPYGKFSNFNCSTGIRVNLN